MGGNITKLFSMKIVRVHCDRGEGVLCIQARKRYAAEEQITRLDSTFSQDILYADVLSLAVAWL